jgi:hypothetical protein
MAGSHWRQMYFDKGFRCLYWPGYREMIVQGDDPRFFMVERLFSICNNFSHC